MRMQQPHGGDSVRMQHEPHGGDSVRMWAQVAWSLASAPSGRLPRPARMDAAKHSVLDGTRMGPKKTRKARRTAHSPRRSRVANNQESSPAVPSQPSPRSAFSEREVSEPVASEQATSPAVHLHTTTSATGGPQASKGDTVQPFGSPDSLPPAFGLSTMLAFGQMASPDADAVINALELAATSPTAGRAASIPHRQDHVHHLA